MGELLSSLGRDSSLQQNRKGPRPPGGRKGSWERVFPPDPSPSIDAVLAALQAERTQGASLFPIPDCDSSDHP